MKNINVGILGSTGLVGQRLIEALDGHPVFKVTTLFARPEKKGQLYYDVVDWVCESKLNPDVAALKLSSIEDWDAYKNVSLVFSALSSDAADSLEGELRKRGVGVVSNAKSFRLHDDVPLLVPEINASALELVETQRKKYNGGFIATNPNCCCIGIALAVGPIEKTLGIESLHIVTMQARSGAGLKGLTAPEMAANVIPNISDEENKIRQEMPKILSRPDLGIKVRTNRVPVVDGHTFNIWIKTKKKSSVKEIISIIKNFKPECGAVPSLSKGGSIYKVYEDNDFMPQPKLDAWFLKGMGTSIGRIEALSDNEFCMTAVSNNIVRGAAGGTLIIAEMLHEKGII
jgi:aspartate-semialdehyde dehydrogenase